MSYPRIMPKLCPCPTCQRHVFSCEETCPHCGERGAKFVAALAIAATVAVACAPQGDVYGPAPVDHSTRVSASATSSQGAPATTNPPDTAIAVYGPPPIDADLRTPNSSSAGTGAGGAPPSASAPKK